MGLPGNEVGLVDRLECIVDRISEDEGFGEHWFDPSPRPVAKKGGNSIPQHLGPVGGIGHEIAQIVRSPSVILTYQDSFSMVTSKNCSQATRSHPECLTSRGHLSGL